MSPCAGPTCVPLRSPNACFLRREICLHLFSSAPSPNFHGPQDEVCNLARQAWGTLLISLTSYLLPLIWVTSVTLHVLLRSPLRRSSVACYSFPPPFLDICLLAAIFLGNFTLFLKFQLNLFPRVICCRSGLPAPCSPPFITLCNPFSQLSDSEDPFPSPPPPFLAFGT